MILKGSQRGSARALAIHLLNDTDNDHVEVHSINGFIAYNVEGAFQEIDAISRATNCKQFMFSLSMSPPEDAVVSDQDFENAIQQAMDRLGLTGQPHVVIFHEKNARRHCHVVVSRIDTDQMKAINLPFFKDRLCELSRELYLTHGWKMPPGHEERLQSDPLNYSLEEHQVAKRAKRDPKTVKTALQKCWTQSDSKTAFTAALRAQGFILCRGDRRGFVAADLEGNIYSLRRWLGIKTKELKERLDDPKSLPDLETALAQFNSHPESADTVGRDQLLAQYDAKLASLTRQKERLKSYQQQERVQIRDKHQVDKIAKIRDLQNKSSGLTGLWNWATGKRHQLIAQHKAELDVLDDAAQTEMLFLSKQQRAERRILQDRFDQLQNWRDAQIGREAVAAANTPQPEPISTEELRIAEQVRRTPDTILDLISDKQARISRNDILRGLSIYIPSIVDRNAAFADVLQSDKIAVVVENGGTPVYATRDLLAAEDRLDMIATKMAATKAYGVRPSHLKSAIQNQNKALYKAVNAKLSEEQRRAITHVVNRRQLSAVIGLAGAGKSTMLSAARDAWEQQGYRVLGAALAGKAADGLYGASGIPSRTLASYEFSWKNGRNLLQPGDVLVVDEAGMVGTHQLARIVEEAHKRRAKLVLVGDPDQLQPINAGAPFRDITAKVGFAELIEIRRQKSGWQKQASLDLARGRITEAMAAYDAHGAIQTEATHEDAITALVEDYMADWELNADAVSRLALAHRRADVRKINNGIRAARKSAGELVDEITAQTENGERSFAVGDRILFTRNDAELGVKNGMLGVITEISADELLIRVDETGNNCNSRMLSVSLNRYAAIDHGYATTVHKSQGATIDHAYVFASRSMDDHLIYVAMTRHRNCTHIYKILRDFKQSNLRNSPPLSKYNAPRKSLLPKNSIQSRLEHEVNR